MATATARSPEEATGFHNLSRRQTTLTMLGLILAMLLGALDQTIVGTALPKIVAELNGFEYYSWVVTAYMVAATTMVPIFGKLSDMFGRKWIYIGGIILFLVASWLAGASQTMWELIAFRGMQGLGAGIMQAIAFAIVGDLFPPAKRGRVQGIFGSVFGLASIVGPTLGGYITDNLNWRWVFYVNIPVGALALIVLFLFFPYFKPEGVRRSIDYWGALAMVLSVVPLLVGLSLAGSQYAWGSAQIIGMLAFAAVMLGVFLWMELRASEPIIPPSLFRNVIFSVSVLTTFLTSVGMFGAIIYIPLFVQGVIGQSATSSGTILIPMMLGMVFSSITSGQLISRTGHYKVFAIVGIAIMTAGMYLLSRMGTTTQDLEVVRNMVVMGLGLGTTMPVFTLAVQNAVPYRIMGTATSSLQFFRSIGGTLGVAVTGSLLNSQFQDAFKSGMSPQLRQAIPADKLSALKDPQALLDPQAQDKLQQMFGQFGPQGKALLHEFLNLVTTSLASAISNVFFLATIAVAVALVASFFLREVPLRKSNQAGLAGTDGADDSDLRKKLAAGLTVEYIANRIETETDRYPGLTGAAAKLVSADGEESEEERALRASRKVLRPLAHGLLSEYLTASGVLQHDGQEPAQEEARKDSKRTVERQGAVG